MIFVFLLFAVDVLVFRFLFVGLPYAGLGAVPCTRTPFDRSQRVEELGHGPWARRGPWPLTSDRCHDDREKAQGQENEFVFFFGD